MKIAITSKGNTLESELDPRFGHCSFFTIYDKTSGGFEVIPNPYKGNEEQAGTQAVKFLKDRGVEKIVSGDFGLKVKPLLDSLLIQMIVIKKPNTTINQIIELINH
ncbi:MAG TPA: NifB/NifX family molybdenum-iron cluster-binding protein [Tenuifilaceae bacterium]|nr:NifB/NifX family molybdenum-iron cluster-binding protein [Tenuifilaceae bacterium]